MPSTDDLHLGRIADSEWVASLFIMAPTEGWRKNEIARRYNTSANTSIGGSGLGNSRVINPPAGICKYADIPRGWGMAGKAGTGSGVCYKELIDDQMEVLTLRPGVPRFNALTVFWSNAFNNDAIQSTEYGWFRNTAKLFGDVIGFVIMAIPKLVGKAYSFLRSLVLGDNSNKYAYYYLSPAPLLYWSGLDTIVNDVAIKLGVTGDVRYSDDYDDGSQKENLFSKKDATGFVAMMPGILNETSLGNNVRIDTLSIANRYTLMNNARADKLKKESLRIFGTEIDTVDAMNAKLLEWEKYVLNLRPMAKSEAESKIGSVRKMLKGMGTTQDNRFNEVMGQHDASQEGYEETEVKSATASADPADPTTNNAWMDFEDPTFMDKFKAVASGGMDCFNIAVDRVTEGSVSISNSVGASSIEAAFNGSVNTAKSAWFAAGGGNVADNPIADAIEAVGGAATATLNAIGAQVIGGAGSALLGGKAYLDVPDVYQDSTTTLQTTSYSLSSRSTSGHPFAKLKMLFPYLALLRLASPISAGPRSFASPFLVEAHMKGKAHIHMGIITALSCTFGGEALWDINRVANALKVDFTITNLSKNFHIPLDPSHSDFYGDQSEFNSHLSVLTGTSLTDIDKSFQYNMYTKFARAANNIDRYLSPTTWAMHLGVGTRDILQTPLSWFSVYVNRA